MPTKRERVERNAKVCVAAFVTLYALHLIHGAHPLVFGVVGYLWLGMFRWMANEADPEVLGYEIHDVDGVERYFCEVCAKEEGDCARCYETEVRLRSDG